MFQVDPGDNDTDVGEKSKLSEPIEEADEYFLDFFLQ